MRKTEVVEALVSLKHAHTKWNDARVSFSADYEIAMKRLINEAARNYMSAEEVARASGIPTARVRKFMRDNGLDPKHGKRLLAKTAAETLAENAALLGVEVSEFDLTSPLAYLPMGSELRALLVSAVDPDEILDEDVDPFGRDIEVEFLIDVFQKAWEAADKRGEAGNRTRAGINAVLDAQKTGATE